MRTHMRAGLAAVLIVGSLVSGCDRDDATPEPSGAKPAAVAKTPAVVPATKPAPAPNAESPKATARPTEPPTAPPAPPKDATRAGEAPGGNASDAKAAPALPVWILACKGRRSVRTITGRIRPPDDVLAMVVETDDGKTLEWQDFSQLVLFADLEAHVFGIHSQMSTEAPHFLYMTAKPSSVRDGVQIKLSAEVSFLRDDDTDNAGTVQCTVHEETTP